MFSDTSGCKKLSFLSVHMFLDMCNISYDFLGMSLFVISRNQKLGIRIMSLQEIEFD